jgi:hypothetical protein
VREALTVRSTAGTDQQAMVRDLCQGGAGVAVVAAVAAYQARNRVVAADSKPAATLALLHDWWAAWQQAEQGPAQEAVVLAARRAEVDRLNSACQQLLTAQSRLGPSGCRSRTASWPWGPGGVRPQRHP